MAAIRTCKDGQDRRDELLVEILQRIERLGQRFEMVGDLFQRIIPSLPVAVLVGTGSLLGRPDDNWIASLAFSAACANSANTLWASDRSNSPIVLWISEIRSSLDWWACGGPPFAFG